VQCCLVVSVVMGMKFFFAALGKWVQILVLLWCTRTLGTVPGWSDLFGGYPDEGTASVSLLEVCSQ
jgi:hypothetical protein